MTGGTTAAAAAASSSSTSEAALRWSEPVLLTPLELKLSIESELVALPVRGERCSLVLWDVGAASDDEA